MKKNLFDSSGMDSGKEEYFEPLVSTGSLLIERIVSAGQSTPPGEWYDQERDEWVMLVSGRAVLSFESGSRLELTPGDHLLIPAHARHRVEETSQDPPCF